MCSFYSIIDGFKKQLEHPIFHSFEEKKGCSVLPILAKLCLSLAANVTILRRFSDASKSIQVMTGVIAGSGILVMVVSVWESCFPKGDKPSLLPRVTNIADRIARLSLINLLNLHWVGPYLHELGHVGTALALFKKAQPKVEIFPFSGGNTVYATSYGLTSLGRLLGKDKGLLVITGGGVCSSTFFALFGFSAAKHLQSQCVHDFALCQLFNEIVYGFAPVPFDLGNDFEYLWQVGGIHRSLFIVPMSLLFLKNI